MAKKLSTSQAFVIDALMQDEKRFIRSSGFYNHQEILDGVQNGYFEMFTKPTLECLISMEYIIRDKSEKRFHKYILNPIHRP